MGTKNIPTIVMLTAGLITSVVMYLNHYDLGTTLKIVLIVFCVFYIIGCWLKSLWDKFCVPLQEEVDEENTEKTEDESEDKQSEDGSVIEKK